MQPLTIGVTKAGTGIDGIVWNILGQTYVPKHVCETSFSWHATFPPGTFVPPHIHPTQDEFIYMLDGKFDLVLDGKEFTATTGDLMLAELFVEPTTGRPLGPALRETFANPPDAPAAGAKRRRKRTAITSEQLASRQLQGRYLALVRRFPPTKRAAYAKIAKEKGREAAIKDMQDSLGKK